MECKIPSVRYCPTPQLPLLNIHSFDRSPFSFGESILPVLFSGGGKKKITRSMQFPFSARSSSAFCITPLCLRRQGQKSKK